MSWAFVKRQGWEREPFERVGARREPAERNVELFGYPPKSPALFVAQSQNWSAHVMIKDQLPANTCSSFAVCSAVEALHSIAGSEIRLDPGYIHFCLAGLTQAMALSLRRAADYLVNSGGALATGVPYPPDPANCPQYTVESVVTSFSDLTSSRAAKQALAAGPIVAGMNVYPDFDEGYQAGSIYRGPTGNVESFPHSVCVVGYSEAHRYWLCANSLGAGWGDEGFFRLAYGECNLLTDTPDAYIAFSMHI